MLVRDEHSSEIFRRASNGRQPLADLAQRKPGINQYPNLIRFKVSAISRGTTPENR
jgi:hypothetical protein